MSSNEDKFELLVVRRIYISQLHQDGTSMCAVARRFAVYQYRLKSIEEILRPVVTRGELDGVKKGQQPSSSTSTCSFVRVGIDVVRSNVSVQSMLKSKLKLVLVILFRSIFKNYICIKYISIQTAIKI